MADAPSINVLGFAGSLRKGSFNRMLLRSAVELAPPGMTIDTFELDLIPLYNGDVEAQGNPEPVAEWKEAIHRADAILVVTPEYNYGVPGVLKNAIDWASRPPGKSVLNGKPAALMGASTGAFGSVRAQLQLRQAFVFTQTHAVLAPDSDTRLLLALVPQSARCLEADADGTVPIDVTVLVKRKKVPLSEVTAARSWRR